MSPITWRIFPPSDRVAAAAALTPVDVDSVTNLKCIRTNLKCPSNDIANEACNHSISFEIAHHTYPTFFELTVVFDDSSGTPWAAGPITIRHNTTIAPIPCKQKVTGLPFLLLPCNLRRRHLPSWTLGSRCGIDDLMQTKSAGCPMHGWCNVWDIHIQNIDQLI